MPERNPFEETMRAGQMNVPQRTVGPTMRDVAGRGRGQVEDVFDQRRLGMGRGPLTFGEQDVFDQRRLGLGGGPQTFGKDPFDPRRLGMDSGSYLSSGYGGGLDDAAGMNDDARGMIEGAGFDVAGKTTDDRVVEKLWGKAVNNFPVGTPDMQIQQEWERLKQLYFDNKYGGYTPGDYTS